MVLVTYGRIDLQQALISAAKSMIRVRDPITLLKLITRFIDRQIGATHVAILVFDRESDSYVFIDSKGIAGLKIPIGYIRVKKDSPIISYFGGAHDLRGKFHREEVLVYDELDHIQNFEIYVNRKETQAIAVTEIKKQMERLGAAICIPSYFKNDLVAVLILGEKLSEEKYLEEEIGVFSTLANDVAMAVTNADLIKNLKESCDREHELLIDTASALSSAIDARDRYTKGHSERVSHYTLVIAAEMIEKSMIPFSREFLEAAQLAGLLHDVGKIGIKDEILNKPATLDEQEFGVMKTHVAIGVNILKPIGGMKEIADGCKYHHERWDGRGYPYGLKGEEIPVLGRIVAVVDSYDTMVTARPYKKARTPEEAFQELRKCSGTHFDPSIVEIFYDAWRAGRTKKRDYKAYDFSIRK